MATAAPPRLHPIIRDRLFFFVMALVIAATAISIWVKCALPPARQAFCGSSCWRRCDLSALADQP